MDKLIKPRGKAAWEARRKLRSNQIPNKRALASKLACKRPDKDDSLN
jgi:hypothetical protein